MLLKPNTILQNGKFCIIRVLGQGGFGITYLAENVLLERKVAIKEFFPKDFCGRDATSLLTIGTQNNKETVEKLKARFLKEARNIAKLDHPGIIKIHDIFEENDTAYYVMDYIEGDNLNEIVKKDGPLSESKAIEYIVKVGEALEYIHSRNMTHFDVKPANILINSKDYEPILIDFGLSKQYDKDGSATSTMMHGVSQGYSPIELYTIGSITTFSPQTDIYSLGATLYYLLTGTVPPNASELIDKSLTFPPTISDSNQEAIKKAMSVSRQNRYDNMAAFLKSLSGYHSNNSHISDNKEYVKCGNKNNDETFVLNTAISYKYKNKNQPGQNKIETNYRGDALKDPSSFIYVNKDSQNIKESKDGSFWAITILVFVLLIGGIILFNIQNNNEQDSYEVSEANGHNQISEVKELSLKDLSEEEKEKLFDSIPISTEQEVDLGLSVNWAGYNIGARKPDQYGDLYRYADPYNKHFETEYLDFIPPLNIMGTDQDIATLQWGKEWYTPSRKNAQELIDKCIYKDTVFNNRRGAIFIGPSRKAIFFPYAGVMYHYGRSQAGTIGVYQLGEMWKGYNTHTKDSIRGNYELELFVLEFSPEVSNLGSGSNGRPVRAVKRRKLPKSN